MQTTPDSTTTYANPSPGYFTRDVNTGSITWKECTPEELSKTYIKDNGDFLKKQLQELGLQDNPSYKDFLGKALDPEVVSNNVLSFPFVSGKGKVAISQNFFSIFIETVLCTLEKEDDQYMMLLIIFDTLKQIGEEIPEELRELEEEFYSDMRERFPNYFSDINTEQILKEYSGKKDANSKKIYKIMKDNHLIHETFIETINQIRQKAGPTLVENEFLELLAYCNATVQPADPVKIGSEAYAVGGAHSKYGMPAFGSYDSKTKAGIESKKIQQRVRSEQRQAIGRWDTKRAIEQASRLYREKLIHLANIPELHCYVYPETEDDLMSLLKKIFTPNELLQMDLDKINLPAIRLVSNKIKETLNSKIEEEGEENEGEGEGEEEENVRLKSKTHTMVRKVKNTFSLFLLSLCLIMPILTVNMAFPGPTQRKVVENDFLTRYPGFQEYNLQGKKYIVTDNGIQYVPKKGGQGAEVALLPTAQVVPYGTPMVLNASMRGDLSIGQFEKAKELTTYLTSDYIQTYLIALEAIGPSGNIVVETLDSAGLLEGRISSYKTALKEAVELETTSIQFGKELFESTQNVNLSEYVQKESIDVIIASFPGVVSRQLSATTLVNNEDFREQFNALTNTDKSKYTPASNNKEGVKIQNAQIQARVLLLKANLESDVKGKNIAQQDWDEFIKAREEAIKVVKGEKEVVSWGGTTKVKYEWSDLTTREKNQVLANTDLNKTLEDFAREYLKKTTSQNVKNQELKQFQEYVRKNFGEELYASKPEDLAKVMRIIFKNNVIGIDALKTTKTPTEAFSKWLSTTFGFTKEKQNYDYYTEIRLYLKDSEGQIYFVNLNLNLPAHQKALLPAIINIAQLSKAEETFLLDPRSMIQVTQYLPLVITQTADSTKKYIAKYSEVLRSTTLMRAQGLMNSVLVLTSIARDIASNLDAPEDISMALDLQNTAEAKQIFSATLKMKVNNIKKGISDINQAIKSGGVSSNKTREFIETTTSDEVKKGQLAQILTDATKNSLVLLDTVVNGSITTFERGFKLLLTSLNYTLFIGPLLLLILLIIKLKSDRKIIDTGIKLTVGGTLLAGGGLAFYTNPMIAGIATASIGASIGTATLIRYIYMKRKKSQEVSDNPLTGAGIIPKSQESRIEQTDRILTAEEQTALNGLLTLGTPRVNRTGGRYRNTQKVKKQRRPMNRYRKFRTRKNDSKKKSKKARTHRNKK